MQISDLAKAGCSVWLDDLSRAKLTGTDSHSLPPRIKNSGVVGVTTNPAIFKAAISNATEYADDIATLKGKSVEEVFQLSVLEINLWLAYFKMEQEASKRHGNN